MRRERRRVGRRPARIGAAVAAVLAIVLVLLAKTPGVVLAVIVVAILLFVSRQNPAEPEIEQIRDSIRLSAEDISGTLAEYRRLTGGGGCPESAAPDPAAISDEHSPEPAILRFHLSKAECERHLAGLPRELRAAGGEVTALEELLSRTDEYAERLGEAWDRAWFAARRPGRG